MLPEHLDNSAASKKKNTNANLHGVLYPKKHMAILLTNLPHLMQHLLYFTIYNSAASASIRGKNI